MAYWHTKMAYQIGIPEFTSETLKFMFGGVNMESWNEISRLVDHAEKKNIEIEMICENGNMRYKVRKAQAERNAEQNIDLEIPTLSF
jgi:hypothetical protein